MSKFTESIVEEATIQYFEDIGYTYLAGPEISSDGRFAERQNYHDVVLHQRLKNAVININKDIPQSAIEDALKKATRSDSPTLVINNRNFHKLITDGIPVEYRREPSPQPSPSGRGGTYRGGFYFSGLVELARTLREQQTPAEALLWELLRNRKLMDLKFRRQHQIGPYIVDFYCSEKRLIIELDGPVHETSEQIGHDRKRDSYLESIGNTVIRFKNAELIDHPEQVLSKIATASARNALPSTLGRGAGGEGVENDSQEIVHDVVWLLDFDNPHENDWLVVNQFTIVENHVNRRPDVVVFVNGLPLGVIELKNPTDENATVKSAYNQIQTYKAQIPTLFNFNEAVIISDGMEAKIGTVSSNWERFMPWRTIDGKDLAPNSMLFGIRRVQAKVYP